LRQSSLPRDCFSIEQYIVQTLTRRKGSILFTHILLILLFYRNTMNSYNIKASSRIQQYLKTLHTKYCSIRTATRTSEPSSTYDAVIIGGGMNVHVSLKLSISVFYKLPCMTLNIATHR
jgi:hypothetical protein